MYTKYNYLTIKAEASVVVDHSESVFFFKILLPPVVDLCQSQQFLG